MAKPQYINSGNEPPKATQNAAFFELNKTELITNKFTGPSCNEPIKLTKHEVNNMSKADNIN